MLINLFHKIFSSKESVTRDEMEHYLSSKTDERTKRLIEDKLAASEFDAEAMEGYEKKGLSPKALQRLDKRFNGQNYQTLWISLAIAAAIILVAILIPREMDQTEQLIAQNQNPTLSEQVEKPPLSEEESSAEIKQEQSSSASDVTQNMDKNVQTRSKQTNPEEQTFANPTEEIKNEIQQASEKQSVPSLAPNLQTIQVDAFPSAAYRAERIQEKEIYLYEHKFIDYRGQRFMPKNENKAVSGTSAQLEKKAKSEVMNKEGDGLTAQSISYHDFLEETARLLKKSDFTNALSNFTAILASYPSDDNALFYSGFCLYKLKKYQSALNFFKKSEESVRENFHEEAEWYIFLCYIEMKDIRNATTQGNNIISRNGFYKTQAERLIKQLD